MMTIYVRFQDSLTLSHPTVGGVSVSQCGTSTNTHLHTPFLEMPSRWAPVFSSWCLTVIKQLSWFSSKSVRARIKFSNANQELYAGMVDWGLVFHMAFPEMWTPFLSIICPSRFTVNTEFLPGLSSSLPLLYLNYMDSVFHCDISIESHSILKDVLYTICFSGFSCRSRVKMQSSEFLPEGVSL